jgi:hypothetical protein
VICLSVLDVICSSILLVCIIRLIPTIIIMFYYWLFQIKSYGNLLIYSTESTSRGSIYQFISLIMYNLIDIVVTKFVYLTM